MDELKVCPFCGSVEAEEYELNSKNSISISDLVHTVIYSELNERERLVITKRYFENMSLNKIKDQFHISNVYDVHDNALNKIRMCLKYVIMYNINRVGEFNESFFRLVSEIAVKENQDE